MQFESLENSSAMAAGGAGISTGQMIASKGVEAVLTGNCGPNAYQVLLAAGVQVITGVSGKIRDAIQAYKSGQFQATSQPSVEAHFGMGATPGIRAGTGFGMGGSMGMGRGRGMGRGMGAGIMPGAVQAPQPISPAQELQALQAQLEALTQQISDVQRRIEELEKKGR
jgi:predicted Fe-Mo cluster-binding NifX family protein